MAGLGQWGPNLLRNLGENPSVSVAALCDRDPARLAKFRDQHPAARLCADLADLANDPQIDAIVVATPAGLHAEHARLLLNAGKDVLVEKPLAMTLREASELVALARSRGRILMTGHTFLFNAAVRRVREEIRQGTLGPLRFISAQRLSLGQVRSDCNALWNLAPHDISILLHWLGETPVSVTARGITFDPRQQQEDIVLCQLEFPSRVLASVHVGWLNPVKVRAMTLVGAKRMLVYDDVDSTRPLTLYDRGLQEVETTAPEGSLERFRFAVRPGPEEQLAVEWREPLAAEVDHFVQCIRRREEPIGSGAEALRVISVLEACQESLRHGGKPVIPAAV
jgi:predicted dehydrogenase